MTEIALTAAMYTAALILSAGVATRFGMTSYRVLRSEITTAPAMLIYGIAAAFAGESIYLGYWVARRWAIVTESHFLDALSNYVHAILATSMALLSLGALIHLHASHGMERCLLCLLGWLSAALAGFFVTLFGMSALGG